MDYNGLGVYRLQKLELIKSKSYLSRVNGPSAVNPDRPHYVFGQAENF